MKVDDAIANAFVKEGSTDVFGLLGDSQMKWWADCSDNYPSGSGMMAGAVFGRVPGIHAGKAALT